jgi:hypothetical protein
MGEFSALLRPSIQVSPISSRTQSGIWTLGLEKIGPGRSPIPAATCPTKRQGTFRAIADRVGEVGSPTEERLGIEMSDVPAAKP